MATDPLSPAGFGLPTGILNPQTNLILRQVRWLDPVGQRQELGDVWLENGRIRAIEPQLPLTEGVTEYPAQGCILGPGLVDVYSQSSEPGYEGRETLSQLVAQAVQGGFTRLTLLPGTQPVVDRAAVVTGWQEQHAQIPLKWRLWGALTQGLQGERMAELAELHRAGVVGFSDGRPLTHLGLLQQLLTYAQPFGKPIALVPHNPHLNPAGVARSGTHSLTWGLPAVPVAAETSALTAILELLTDLDMAPPVHLMRISTQRGVALVAQAKDAGLPLTASTPWTHLLWDSSHLGAFNPYLRFDPPLGNPADRLALIQGVKTGVIDAIAIDHQAYTYEEKMVPFGLAPPRLPGLGMALSYLWAGLVTPGHLTAGELWSSLSTKALHCLGEPPVTLTPGAGMALTLLAPEDAPPDELPLPGIAQGRVRWVMIG
ncbi:dihydroorotase [Gloeomargaritales cyanobacterium VI4D9]|nr:dihydroorotase [Gloeomargaritales cyanobacterium VI4D9]